MPTQGWINIIRNSLNMTQKQLADKLGIGRTGVGEIERREAGTGFGFKVHLCLCPFKRILRKIS